ncbi:hypothetical protein HPG69_019735 [Diceros bicornis minor]|uniref:Uncharacterized protein n=1 Tax=Diceros bicornis minor TaxID=77932 RepID=A0A7J7EGS7_DICBM|nr:hypothetical protein HPG69_019735 [Diceros bicornis minor]
MAPEKALMPELNSLQGELRVDSWITLVDEQTCTIEEVSIFALSNTLYRGNCFKTHITFPIDCLCSTRDFRLVVCIWHANTYKNGELQLAKSLGQAGEIEPETEGILTEYGVDFSDFSSEVLECLPQHLPWTIPPEEFNKRRDLSTGIHFGCHMEIFRTKKLFIHPTEAVEDYKWEYQKREVLISNIVGLLITSLFSKTMSFIEVEVKKYEAGGKITNCSFSAAKIENNELKILSTERVLWKSSMIKLPFRKGSSGKLDEFQCLIWKLSGANNNYEHFFFSKSKVSFVNSETEFWPKMNI